MAHTLRRGWNEPAHDWEFIHKIVRDTHCRPGCAVCGRDPQHLRVERKRMRRAGKAEIRAQLQD